MSTADLRPLPSQERLQEMFNYDPQVGILFRKRRSPEPNRFDTRWAGKPAGKTAKGHVYVTVDGQLFLVHRVVWKWMTGGDPPDNIDHEDQNPSNNRFGNLRIAGKSANGFNRGMPRNNTSGHKNVYRATRTGKWFVQLRINRRHTRIGTYESYEEACAAADARAKKEFGEFFPEKDPCH